MLELPIFLTLVKKFLYWQLYPHSEHSFSEALEAFYLEINDKIHMLRLQTIKSIVNSRSFKGPKSDEPRRVQVLDLYCLTRFESEGSSKGIVY